MFNTARIRAGERKLHLSIVKSLRGRNTAASYMN